MYNTLKHKKYKAPFSLIVGLGILVSGMSSAANAGGGYNCRSSKSVTVTQPYSVQQHNRYSYYRYQTYPQYQSWRYGYSKAKGWYGGYRYRYYRYH